MCGAPAERWRKFNFSTAPSWAFLLGAIAMFALSRRASGYLPMTRQCMNRLRLLTWGSLALLPVAVVLWIAGALAVPPDNDAVRGFAATVLLLLGLVSLMAALVGLILRRFYGPTGRVMEQQYGQYEPVVELQRVHPNFVVAVQQLQQSRAAQFSSQAHATFQP